MLHRGYHAADYLSRPVENTLSAYELGWSNGFQFCECDIAVTKDGFIVLCHDDTMARLGLPHAKHTTKIKNLLFKEIVQHPLRNGSRLPLLTEVLQSCSHFEQAKLVVEVKEQAIDITPYLKKLIVENPKLCENIAVVMSFDLELVSKMKKELPLETDYIGLLDENEYVYQQSVP